jgi:iron complex outermembrane receptor protein
MKSEFGKTFIKLLGAGVSVSALVLSASAFAQTAPAAKTAAVEEVVVTARQRQEVLKEVPASVTALTALKLKEAGVSRAQDFVALTAGVSLVQAAEVGDSQINIRGNNSARDAQSSFAFVLDGIQMANPASFNREYTDLKQIEVVKGPQGAIYGRNAAAGAIIVTTEKPGDRLEGMAQASFANKGAYTLKGRVAGPIANNISGSLSGDWRKTDGFYQNQFTGQGLDKYDGYNINGRIIAKPSDKTEIDVKARWGSLDAGSIMFNSIFQLPAIAKAFGAAAFSEDVNTHKFIFQNNVPHENHQDGGEISAKVDHDLGFATLTGWLLYSDIKNDILADGTSAAFGFFNADAACISSVKALTGKVALSPPTFFAGTPDASILGAYTPSTCDGYQYQRRDQRDVSLEVRLTSPSSQKLRWLGGVYYLNIDRQVGVSTGIDSGTGTPPRQLYVPAGQPYATEQLLYDNFTSDAYAVFGQMAYDFLPNVEGSLALRYDREDRSSNSLVPTGARNKYIDYNGPPYTGGAPLNPGLDSFLNPGGLKPQSKSYAQLEPKVGLRWTIDPQWTVYGDWGVGFKSGGFNNAGSRATINTFINPARALATGYVPVNIYDDFKKETSDSFEFGTKARLFDGRLILDAAVYQTKVKDMQFFEFFVGPFGLLRVVSNIDRVTLQGEEIGAQLKLTDNLRFEASGAITDSKIDRNSSRPQTVGNKAPYTPDYTWNLAVQYDRPIGGSMNYFLRTDVRGIGPTWFHAVQGQNNPTVFGFSFGPVLGLANYATSQRKAYTTVDLRTGIESDRWSLTLFGQNIGNTKYLAEVIPAPEFGGSFGSPGAKATYGVEVGVKF